jgi:hypothetical protein
MLQKALPGLTVGSDAHKQVLSAITGISRVVPQSNSIAGTKPVNMRGLMQDAQQHAMMGALDRANQQSMGSASAPGSMGMPPGGAGVAPSPGG